MDADDTALTVLDEALSSGVEESVKEFGGKALESVLSEAVAGILAATLAGAAKALVGALWDKASIERKLGRIERKLDQVLYEPLHTATTSISEILSAPLPQNQDEEAHFAERLNRIAGKLEEAYSFAPPGKKLLVRFYQALVVALQRGGAPSLAVYVNEFRTVASHLNKEAELSELNAGKFRAIAIEYGDALKDYEGLPPQEFRGIVVMPGASEAQQSSKYWDASKAASDIADQKRTLARELELYTEFVIKLAEIQILW